MPKVVVVMVGANDLTAAYAQCGTWDSNDYYGAAATIAQQYVTCSVVWCYSVASVLLSALVSSTGLASKSTSYSQRHA